MKKVKLKVPSIDELLKKAKPKKPKESVSNRLGVILSQQNMTQAELSELTELYPSHISEIISGKRKGVTLPIALKIAKALKMKVEDIFFEPKIVNK